MKALRTSLLFAVLLGSSAGFGQATYTSTLPTMEGSSLSSWRTFAFPGATPTTGGGTLTFAWRACWQEAFGGSSKIWIELETGTGTYTQVYYETGNTMECAALSRTATVSAAVLSAALNTGGSEVRGRVKIQDSCYPGVGCSFYNDPQVLNFTLSYETHAANFGAADASVCPGATVAFSDASLGTPSSYTWLFPGGTPATSAAQNPTVQYATPGSYDVTLIVGTLDGPDTLLREAFVTVYEPPAANAGVDEDLCAGGSAQLQASGGSTYQWFPTEDLDAPESAAPMASPATTTSYTVLVTDANGCQASDNMILTVHPLPTVQASAGNDRICLGDTAYAVAVGAQLYQWSPALFINTTIGAAVELYPTSTFTWTVTGTDAFGCVGETSMVLNVDPPPPAPVITNAGTHLSSSAAAAYQWYLNGQAIPDATTQDWVPLANGNYSVRITDANGCTALGLPVYFGNVGLSALSSDRLKLYPQPVRDHLVIEGLTGTTPARVLNAQGALVWQGTLQGERSSIDMGHLATGTYTVELQVGASPQRMVVVKE